MLLLDFEMQDFMGHSHSHIDCTKFNSCLIVGKNKNNKRISNGVGKSTIFHGISYCIYNEAPSKKFDQVIRDGADSCWVRGDFQIDDSIYRIKRERDKKSYHVYLYKKNENSNDWTNISAKTNKQTEELIRKIFKMPYKAFLNSVMFAQNDLSGLASASPDNRKDLLKEPLQISVYNKYLKAAKERQTSIKVSLEKTKELIKELGNPNLEIEEINLKIKKINTELKATNFEIKTLEEKISEDKIALSNLEISSSSEMKKVSNNITGLEKKIKQLEVSRETLVTSIEKAKGILGSLKSSIVDKQSNKQDKKEEIVKIQSLNLRDVEDVNSELEMILNQEKQGEAYTLSIQSKISSLNKVIPEGDKCQVCFQPIDEKHRSSHEAFKENEIENHQKSLQKYGKVLNDCKKYRENLQSEKKKIEKYKDRIKNINMEIENIENSITNDQNSARGYFDLLNEKEDSLNLVNEDVKNLKIELKTMFEFVKNNKKEDNDKKIFELRSNLEYSNKKNQELISKISSLNTEVGIFQEKLNTKNKNLDKLKDLNDFLEKENKNFNMSQRIVKAFGSHGIPSMIINTILDDLQIEGNNILSELRPNLHFEIDSDNENDKLNLYFYVYGKKREYLLLSGGQKLYFSLALKLGLSKVVQKRLGVDVNFIAMDEVDQSLDKEGVDAFSTIVKKLQNQFKIFVITHNEQLKEKFNDFIIVEGDDSNGSSAYYSDVWEN